MLSTPVVFIIFNRPDLTKLVFSAIRQAQPTQLFVIADGARSLEEQEKCQQTRDVINQVDWDCDVLLNYSDVNLGCRQRISSGITWVFEHVEEAIILEDDCLPTASFFPFCQNLLEYYREDSRIIGITGNNFQNGISRTNYSYYFSKFNHCWGWATWRRAWKYWDFNAEKWLDFKNSRLIKQLFDNPNEEKYWTDIFDNVFLEGKPDSWAYVWLFCYWSQGGLSVLPDQNLVSNIGFRGDGTHTLKTNNILSEIETTDIWEIKHPPFVVRNKEADTYTFDYTFGGMRIKQNSTLIGKIKSMSLTLLAKIKPLVLILKYIKLFCFVLYAMYLYLTLKGKLIGRKFDLYGKKISFLFLLKKRIKIFINLFCNPVNIVRYFEFPFVYGNVNWMDSVKYLDVSSPRLFYLYALTQNSNLELEVINPDRNDLNETKLFLQTLELPNKINLNLFNVTELPYPDQHFDVITSISVIEHIPDRGDTLAMQEMWRVLKSGGKLVITVPCKKKSEDEWRERNIYGLVNEKQGNKYFFQRFYDNNTLIERLFSAIAIEPVVKEFFGEKQDKIFSEYEQRWIRDGLKETVKDPLHIVRDYQKFSTVDDLPGMGVCGLVFEKP